MERAIIASVLGLPGYAAIGIALGFTGLGVFIDLERINGLGTVFKGCYFIGCVLAVCWVKRRALFGPMVQPPLLLALAVPGVVLAAGDVGTRGGAAARLLAIATPLLNGFPTMAATTGFVLIIGIARYRVQRPSSEPDLIQPVRPVPPRDESDPDEAAHNDRERPERNEPARPIHDDAESGRSEVRSGDAARERPERNVERTAQPERQSHGRRPQEGRPQRPSDQRPSRPDEDDDEPTSLLPLSGGGPAEPRRSEAVAAQPGRSPAGKSQPGGPPTGKSQPGRPPAGSTQKGPRQPRQPERPGPT